MTGAITPEPFVEPGLFTESADSVAARVEVAKPAPEPEPNEMRSLVYALRTAVRNDCGAGASREAFRAAQDAEEALLAAIARSEQAKPAPEPCSHPSWHKIENEQIACDLCGEVGDERRYLHPRRSDAWYLSKIDALSDDPAADAPVGFAQPAPEAVEPLRAALDRYLRVCRSGGMPRELSDKTAPEPLQEDYESLARIDASLAQAETAPVEADMPAICAALGFDPTNHHNAAKCPYCRGALTDGDPRTDEFAQFIADTLDSMRVNTPRALAIYNKAISYGRKP